MRTSRRSSPEPGRSWGSSRTKDQFAVGWDDLAPLIPGRDDYRVLISLGRIAYAFVVEGQLACDGAIKLVSIELDLTGQRTDASPKGISEWDLFRTA